MHINSSGEHVLDDPFVCSFLRDNPGLYSVIDSFVHVLCVHYSQPVSSVHTFEGDLLSRTLESMRVTTDSILRKVDVLSSVRGSNRSKGDDGERGLHDALASALPRRDGYSIVDTHTIPHSCDMVIRRFGYPDIRVESKAYRQSVCSSGMDKFESDLTRLNNHGIFVSLYSGICGKGSFEFEFLPSVGKFAFYVSNNQFDGVMLGEIVRLIYKMDHLLTPLDGSVYFSHETLGTIKSHLSDMNRKIDDLKTNSKNSLRMLNELSLGVISNLLFGVNDSTTHECDQCHGIFKTKAGLTLHRKKCSSTS